MTDNLTGFLYLLAAVLFILALRGLSSPETARQGNIFGIAGMVIAETEYRGEIEVITAPFRGLGLGIFLITVGMSVDFRVVLARSRRGHRLRAGRRLHFLADLGEQRFGARDHGDELGSERLSDGPAPTWAAVAQSRLRRSGWTPSAGPLDRRS